MRALHLLVCGLLSAGCHSGAPATSPAAPAPGSSPAVSARLCGDLGSSDPAVRVAAARELSRGMFWVGGTEQMFDAAEASCKKMGLGSR